MKNLFLGACLVLVSAVANADVIVAEADGETLAAKLGVAHVAELGADLDDARIEGGLFDVSYAIEGKEAAYVVFGDAAKTLTTTLKNDYNLVFDQDSESAVVLTGDHAESLWENYKGSYARTEAKPHRLPCELVGATFDTGRWAVEQSGTLVITGGTLVFNTGSGLVLAAGQAVYGVGETLTDHGTRAVEFLVDLIQRPFDGFDAATERE